ncbi:MAG: ZIP family metal transporter [Gemmatimonadales bacterium]|jgi:ZIP family zinc transporter/zinc and cadmium transporter|nr:ZIP family metal transporter [Gemmatimonadales bacterium]
MNPLAYAALAAMASVAGALVVIRRSPGGVRALDLALAFGAGFMLAVVLLGMLPAVFAEDRSPTAWLLGGFLAVHLTQHVLTPHFHFGEETHHVAASAGVTAALGLSLHAFFDGVAIAGGFRVSGELGLLLFLAVFVHKLPEGLSIASLSLAGGQSPARAFGLSLVPAVATLLGGLLTGRVEALATHGLALAAGVTLYVAGSNLVPALQARRDPVTVLTFVGGVLAYLGSAVLLHGMGAP